LTKTKKLRLAPTNKTYCEIGRAKVRIYYSQCKQLRNIILYGSNIPPKGWKLVDKNIGAQTIELKCWNVIKWFKLKGRSKIEN